MLALIFKEASTFVLINMVNGLNHNLLKWLYSFQEPQEQITHWLEVLAEYNFTIWIDDYCDS